MVLKFPKLDNEKDYFWGWVNSTPITYFCTAYKLKIFAFVINLKEEEDFITVKLT